MPTWPHRSWSQPATGVALSNAPRYTRRSWVPGGAIATTECCGVYHPGVWFTCRPWSRDSAQRRHGEAGPNSSGKWVFTAVNLSSRATDVTAELRVEAPRSPRTTRWWSSVNPWRKAPQIGCTPVTLCVSAPVVCVPPQSSVGYPPSCCFGRIDSPTIRSHDHRLH